MPERCPYCGRIIEGYLTETLDNGNPACSECIAKEEAARKEKEDKKNES